MAYSHNYQTLVRRLSAKSKSTYLRLGRFSPALIGGKPLAIRINHIIYSSSTYLSGLRNYPFYLYKSLSMGESRFSIHFLQRSSIVSERLLLKEANTSNLEFK